MDVIDSDTTWGRRSSRYETDVRALRRYNRLLAKTARAGEVAVFIMLVTAVGGVAKVLWGTNFENGIVLDGTTNVCFYDGNTGQIRNVE
ncbi:hypothetical protein [Tahibacter amnicola]|uniref:Uncharacterized protein n=1 Tax=Tahibacter amnicola TaxID=2976241 RepID=A0ABY6BGB4_9GAMM|nr:hypothetical protein [Tahibacter amnicola]UXI68338.1 hypothetical protein N4264_01420 [Tahibacter amnicola]